MIEPHGGFVLVHLATALEVCEGRDRKGLYARARAGIVKEFTGISDPYEIPTDAELSIDTAVVDPDQAAERIMRHLEQQGFLGSSLNRARALVRAIASGPSRRFDVKVPTLGTTGLLPSRAADSTLPLCR